MTSRLYKVEKRTIDDVVGCSRKKAGGVEDSAVGSEDWRPDARDFGIFSAGLSRFTFCL